MNENTEDDDARRHIAFRDEIFEALRRVRCVDGAQSVLEFVKDLEVDPTNGKVSFAVELPSTLSAAEGQGLVLQTKKELSLISWIESLHIPIRYRPPQLGRPSIGTLRDVTFVVAVASCKGGVGKSTVACNLAFELQSMGCKVGLVDADVYGPSLPLLVDVGSQKVKFVGTNSGGRARRILLTVEGSAKDVDGQDQTSRSGQKWASGRDEDKRGDICGPSEDIKEEKRRLEEQLVSGEGGLAPLVHKGVKMMSYGFLSESSCAAIRGPIASTLVFQMVTQTLWGSLDFLIIDLPPGTGDVHLTLAQSVPINGSVMVTTPQQLSFTDVERGIEMFNKLDLPTVALVENMSFYECSCCRHRSTPFSDGADEATSPLDQLIKGFRIPIKCVIPLHQDFAKLHFQVAGSDNSQISECPLVAAVRDDHPVRAPITKLCRELINTLNSIAFSTTRMPTVRVDANGDLELVVTRASGESQISSAPCKFIRAKCQCAECVDEMSGQPKYRKRVPLALKVSSLSPRGTYAVAIEWSDGHQSLMSFANLERIMQQHTTVGINNNSSSSSESAPSPSHTKGGDLSPLTMGMEADLTKAEKSCDSATDLW